MSEVISALEGAGLTLMSLGLEPADSLKDARVAHLYGVVFSSIIAFGSEGMVPSAAELQEQFDNPVDTWVTGTGN